MNAWLADKHAAEDTSVRMQGDEHVGVQHTFWKPKPCCSAYRSIYLINLSHSKALRIMYFASILSGFPLTNFAWTSTVENSPSSSIMNRPVMSPSSSEDSNTEGVLNTKVAVPDEPSLDLVNLTSGTLGSSIPLINCKVAALQTSCWL